MSFEAAPARTGSELLQTEQCRDGGRGFVSTACPGIDRALGGGFPVGRLVCVSAAVANARTILAYHTITQHLSQNAANETVIIDSSGSFSVHHLRDVMHQTLRKPNEGEAERFREQAVSEIQSGNAPTGSVQDAVMRLLDRVKIIRVFDVTGLVETIDEMGKAWRSLAGRTGQQEALDRDETPVPQASAFMQHDYQDDASPAEMPDKSRHGRKIGLVIVDDLPSLFQKVQSRDGAEAQSLLLSFCRSTAQLVRNHDMCAILFNGVVGTGVAPETFRGEEQRESQEDASRLASIHGKPALGKMLAHVVDLSVMISAVPPGRQGPENAFAGLVDQEARGQGGLSILEVLKDRGGTTLDGFTIFRVDHLVLEDVGGERGERGE